MKPLETLKRILATPSTAETESERILMILELYAEEVDDWHHRKLLSRMLVLYSDTNRRLEETLEEVKRLSVTDPLTGLYNRLKFNEMLQYEIARHRRIKEPMSLTLFDIDHFKAVNDTHGHDVGDQVLVALGTLVSATIRPYDTFARWGGEEFILLTPEMEARDAEHLAERLRQAIENHPFPTVGRVTCSFGITAWDPEDDGSSLIKRADEALYTSKRTGRNKVTVNRKNQT